MNRWIAAGRHTHKKTHLNIDGETSRVGYQAAIHSPCPCVCLCSRAPVGQPITGRIPPAACPPSAAAPSTLRLLRSPRCPLCTAALLHDQRWPARCTGRPDTAKHRGSSWIKGRKPKRWRGMSVKHSPFVAPAPVKGAHSKL